MFCYAIPVLPNVITNALPESQNILASSQTGSTSSMGNRSYAYKRLRRQQNISSTLTHIKSVTSDLQVTEITECYSSLMGCNFEQRWALSPICATCYAKPQIFCGHHCDNLQTRQTIDQIVRKHLRPSWRLLVASVWYAFTTHNKLIWSTSQLLYSLSVVIAAAAADAYMYTQLICGRCEPVMRHYWEKPDKMFDTATATALTAFGGWRIHLCLKSCTHRCLTL